MIDEPASAAPGAYVIVDDASDPGAFSFAPRVGPNRIPADQKKVMPSTYAELEYDLSSPALDTLACAAMCVIVVALLASGAVGVNVKGLETMDVESNARTATFVGIFCGLASRRLGLP